MVISSLGGPAAHNPSAVPSVDGQAAPNLSTVPSLGGPVAPNPFATPSLGGPAAQNALAVPPLGGPAAQNHFDGPVTRRSPNALHADVGARTFSQHALAHFLRRCIFVNHCVRLRRRLQSIMNDISQAHTGERGVSYRDASIVDLRERQPQRALHIILSCYAWSRRTSFQRRFESGQIFLTNIY